MLQNGENCRRFNGHRVVVRPALGHTQLRQAGQILPVRAPLLQGRGLPGTAQDAADRFLQLIRAGDSQGLQQGGLLVQSREVTQYSWQPAVSLWAQLDQVVCAPLAEALYRERVDNFLDAWPDAEVRGITDDRFDQAVVVDTGSSQFFAARLGRIVLAERVETDTDLKEHLDDFAAVLAEFQ